MITTSSYTEGPAQIDGRRYVTELHTDDAGKTYIYEWLGSQDAGPVMSARVSLLNSQIAERDAALAQVSGTQLPMTKLAFRGLFTESEKQAIDALNAGFESHPTLTAAQKAAIRTGLEDYKMAENIALPFDARVQNMVGLYAALGLITSERMAEVLNG